MPCRECLPMKAIMRILKKENKGHVINTMRQNYSIYYAVTR